MAKPSNKNKRVSVAGLTDVVSSIKETYTGFMDDINNVINYINKITTLNIDRKKIKDVAKAIDTTIDIILDTCRQLERREKRIDIALRVLPKFYDFSTALLQYVNEINSNLNSIVVSSADPKTIKKSIKTLFKTYYSIVDNAIDLGILLTTGRRPGFHLFRPEYNIKDIYVGLASFSTLSVLLGQVFKLSQGLIDGLSSLGTNNKQIRAGINTLDLLLFGKRKLIGKPQIGLIDILVKIASVGAVKGSEDVGTWAKIKSKIMGYKDIAIGIAALTVVFTYFRLMTPLIEATVDVLSKLGSGREMIGEGLLAIDLIINGGSKRKYAVLKTDIPGIIDILTGTSRFAGESNDEAGRNTAFIAKNNLLAMKDALVGALAISILLNVFNSIIGKALVGTASYLSQAAGFGKKKILTGLEMLVVMLGGGSRRNWRLKKIPIPGLIEIVKGIDLTPNEAKEQLTKLTELTIVTLEMYAIVKLVQIIGGIKKRQIRKGLDLLFMIFNGGSRWSLTGKKHVPSLFEIIDSIKVSKKTMLSTIVKLLILNTVVLMMLAIIVQLATIGLLALPAVLGILAANIVVLGLVGIVKLFKLIDKKTITGAVEKLVLIAPILVGELGLIAIVSAIAKLALEPKSLITVLLFVAASTILLAGMIAQIKLVYLVRKNIPRGIELIKMLLVSLLATKAEGSLVTTIDGILKLNLTSKSLISVLLFLAASTILLAGMIAQIKLVYLVRKNIPRGIKLIKMLLVSLLATKAEGSLVTTIDGILKLNLTSKSLISVLLFLAASTILITGIVGMILLLKLLPLTTIVAGITELVTVVGSCLLLAVAIMKINAAVIGINSEGLLVFIGVTLAFVGLSAVLGLAAPVIALSIIGAGLMLVNIGMIFLVSLMLVALSKIKIRDLQQAKINAEIVFDTCNEIILSFLFNTVGTPKNGQANTWGKKLLMYVGGPITQIIESIFAVAYVAFVFIAITFVLLIAVELTLLGNLKLQPDKILSNVDTVFSTAKSIMDLIFNGSQTKAGYADAYDKMGVFGVLINAVLPPLVPVLEAIFAVLNVAMIFISVTLILLTAAGLRVLQDINLEKDKIEGNVKKVLDTGQYVTNILRENKRSEETKNTQPWWRRALGALPLVGGVTDIVEAILNIGSLALTMISIGLVTVIAKNLEYIGNLELNPDKIRENLSGPNGIITISNQLVTDLKESKTETISETKVKQFGVYVDDSVKLMKNINKLDDSKLLKYTDMWKTMTEFMNTVKDLDISELSDAIVNKIAPAMSDISDNVDKMSTGSTSTTTSIAAVPNQTSTPKIMTPTQSMTNKTEKKETIDYTSKIDEIIDLLDQISRNTVETI